MLTVLLVAGAYLLGAIPFGLLIGKAHGVDIRTQGSRNIGATNVGRVLGRKWGYACLLLDVLKGFGPALTASLLLLGAAPAPAAQGTVVLVAVAAVLGHVFPVYLRFKGGKGVATTVGVALGVWPYYTFAMFIALIAYAAVRFPTGKVSVGSLTLAVAFPIAVYGYLWIGGLPVVTFWPLQLVAVLLGVVIVVRHRENIRRLLSGEEFGTRAGVSDGRDSSGLGT